MKQTVFHFKQFSVKHDKSGMQVGTDGVLLGSMATFPGQGRVLDVGCGSGLISLMLAQRYPNLSIDAIDVDKHSAKQARENIDASPWNKRIKVLHTSLQDYDNGQYHGIISNPPFYRNALHPTSSTRKQSKHAESLPLTSIFEFANTYLHPDGVLWLIYPFMDKGFLYKQASAYNFHIASQYFIKPNIHKAAHRLVVAFVRTKTTPDTHAFAIELSERHSHTWQYKRLCRIFLLRV
ncbi:MAG: methyltransferase [Candidatus Delongbacteria bacterium]|jgi:tRNA1Val (adenine37-N6)-methyltransferase|nr:methyltransferase [Candidatus Delongbacteria bacterium]